MAVRVLVVDDAAFMRMMVKDILSKNGYEVVGEPRLGNDGYYNARNGRNLRS